MNERADENGGAPLDTAWRRWVPPAIGVLALATVGWVLHRTLAAHHAREVLEALRAIPTSAVLLALALTAVSYCVLTLNDWLGIRYVGKPVAYPRTALTSFVAYAFGHNLSLAAFTGAAVRYRIYSTQGLTTVDVATVVTFCAITTSLGIGVTAGTALLVAAPGTTALQLGHVWTQVVGALLLGAVATYVLVASRTGSTLQVGPWLLRAPGARLVLPQLGVAILDLAVASAVLWVLLPAAATIDYPTFAGVYALAVVGGIVSQVPGGLGVFETIVLLALPHVPAPQLLGSLVAYRGIYYFAPLLVAAVLLALHELWQQRERLGRVHAVTGQYVAPILMPIAPQLIGVLVFVGGAVLLLSGATPALDARLSLVRGVLPLPVLELSHLAGSLVGVGLLVVARGLFRRLRAAYHLTVWLLAAGVAASIVKGLDFEEAAFLALVLAVTALARPAFYRPSSLRSQRFTPAWLASIATVLALSIWVGLATQRHVPYANELWWTFAVHGDAPRMLRASLAASVVLAGLVASTLLQPAPVEPHDPQALDRERVRRAVAASGSSLANAALAGDKRVLFHPAGDAFVMYQVSGRSWIALGDPVGPVEHHEDLVWAFRELVDRRGGRTVFYQISDRSLPLYIDLGLSLLKLGEEARIELAAFTLDGSARADLRQARRRAERDGATFEVLPPERVPAVLPRLRAISDDWLHEKATAEKGFSLGAFSEDYVAQFPVAVVRNEGSVVAFANLWPTSTREELSIDLMRFGPDAPRSAMDYLFVELMLWARAEGYRWFNLGMAPLSGLERRALAPIWHRMGSFLFSHGESFYNFEGLRRYKEKFQPQWEPRYLASPRGLQLPRVLYDVSTLISGGLLGLVRK